MLSKPLKISWKPAILLLPLLAFACARKEPVVAQIGQDHITLEEFKTAYFEVIKQPNVFDAPPLREQFLDELIDRRLLAAEAKTMGMAGDERLRYRIDANRDKNLRDAHYQQVIKPQISLAESDIEQAYAFMNEQRHIRHLFSENRSGADSLCQLLLQSARWEDLALAVFQDPRLSESGGDLGWVDWEQMEYDLAMTAFTLPLNGFSRPVASSYGWHILQVVDWKKAPLLSQTNYELQRRNARTVLENKLGDKAAQAYIAGLMAAKKIQIYPKSLRAVGQQLGALLQRPPSTMDQMRAEQLSDAELGRIETSLWDMRLEPLASIDGEALTIGEFVAALNYVPYHAVHKSLKTALDYVLRDRALTREARDLGLERNPEVRIKTALFEQSRLQMALRLYLLADVKVDENDLRSYFDAHYAAKYPKMAFADARELISRDALSEKRASLLREHILQLRSKTKISRNADPIHAWYDGLRKK